MKSMTKRIVSCIVAVSLVLSLALAVSANSGIRRCCASDGMPKGYQICTVADCALEGLHRHGSRRCVAVCAFEDCAALGYHEHDGVYCYGLNTEDGICGHRNTAASKHCCRNRC